MLYNRIILNIYIGLFHLLDLVLVSFLLISSKKISGFSMYITS